jgi:hypothetical protein
MLATREGQMPTDLGFSPQEVELGRARADIKIQNVSIDAEWISGIVEVHVSAAGFNIDESIPFKTKNNLEEILDLPYGAKLILRTYLKSENEVCARCIIKWGPVNMPMEKCVSIQ